jgi:hypothetical protein
MASRRTATTAYDLPQRALKGQWQTYDDIGRWLCEEIDFAISARGQAADEIRYAWALYQQDRTRTNRLPWPNAADLTSPFAAEYVDALHARLMTTIFTEPVWTVEGWGPSAARAPYVEEFHQRAQEDERMQGYADEWFMRGLVEGVGILEVSEAVELRREVRRIKAALKRDEMTGDLIMGPDHKPVLEVDADGRYREVDDDTPEPMAEVEIDAWEPVRVGPAYDVVPYLDFVTLPGHARDKSQVWAHAKRFWRRVPELQARAKAGVYDAAAVTAIGTHNERTSNADDAPAQPVIVDQRDGTAQKELFEVQVLADFDGQGERWWRVTLHKDSHTVLRLKRDDRTTRYIRVVPFPKPGVYDRGYSTVTNKLMTVIEEDTAARNMYVDRMAFKASQPILRRAGALWEPYEQPIGPGTVLDVKDMDELRLLQGIEDVPPSLMAWRQSVRQDAERALGQNDVSVGQETQERRTLGEVQLVAGYAEVRVNVILRRCQEALEELFQARHTIWKRTLQSRSGSPTLRSMVLGKDAMGIDVSGLATDGTITAEMLDGIFWGKPKGSVETADLNRQRQDFNSFLQALAPLLQLNPQIRAVFSTIPAARSLIKTALKVNRVQDVQSILGSEANDVFAQIEAQQRMQSDPRMQMLTMLMQAAGGPGDGAAPPALAAGPPTPTPERPPAIGATV